MSIGVEVRSPPSKTLLMFEGRAMPEYGAFWLMRPWLLMTPRGDDHPVMVLPGLLASDASTKALRGFLNAHGYKAHGWKLGRNLGLHEGTEAGMLGRIDELFDRYGGRKVSLVGWSLGGLYARQLAKLRPDKVRSLITLGSPFAGVPQSSNAWRAYELAAGKGAGNFESFTKGLAAPPPMPTTSIFSRTDGICAWRDCLNEEDLVVENIEVYGSHCGLGHLPAAVYAVADRLAQPEGSWKKFDRSSGWRLMSFPDWRRK